MSILAGHVNFLVRFICSLKCIFTMFEETCTRFLTNMIFSFFCEREKEKDAC